MKWDLSPTYCTVLNVRALQDGMTPLLLSLADGNAGAAGALLGAGAVGDVVLPVSSDYSRGFITYPSWSRSASRPPHICMRVCKLVVPSKLVAVRPSPRFCCLTRVRVCSCSCSCSCRTAAKRFIWRRRRGCGS